MSMNKGIWYGIGAYSIWGLFPLYWKAMAEVPAFQIVAHRLIWSLVFLALLIVIRRDWAGFKTALRGRTLLIYTAAAVLLTINWMVYVWAVNAGFVVETSLGYFINPLVSVLLGMVFLGERLTLGKWIPVGLAAAGVLYLTISYGSLPWISLALAFTFALYGLLKKLSPLGSLHGLTMETAILFLPSLAYLGFVEYQGVGALGHASSLSSFLLILAGVVTALPLLLFSAAARSIPLWTVGLLQFIAPTLQFLLGVLVFRETFSPDKLIGFSLIWLALLIFSYNQINISLLFHRREAAVKQQ
jgi:chloramphenicol-sensitive protein RarD